MHACSLGLYYFIILRWCWVFYKLGAVIMENVSFWNHRSDMLWYLAHIVSQQSEQLTGQRLKGHANTMIRCVISSLISSHFAESRSLAAVAASISLSTRGNTVQFGRSVSSNKTRWLTAGRVAVSAVAGLTAGVARTTRQPPRSIRYR